MGTYQRSAVSKVFYSCPPEHCKAYTEEENRQSGIVRGVARVLNTIRIHTYSNRWFASLHPRLCQVLIGMYASRQASSIELIEP